MIGHLILRLIIWFLLTANFTVENIIIGVIIAFLLPRGYTTRERLTEWIQVMSKLFVAIPIAFVEAFEIIFRPHNKEEMIPEEIKLKRSPLLIFIDVFLITFTPKTIVVRYNEQGFYEVHHIKPGKE